MEEMGTPGKTEKTSLKRTLTLTDLTLFGVASIMGSGGFNLIGKAVGAGGSWWPIALLVPAVLLMGAAHSYAGAFERFKKDTSESDIVRAIFGPLAGDVGTAAILVYNLVSVVVILVFCSKMLLPAGSWLAQSSLTIGLLAAMTGLALAGIELNTLLINGTTMFLIGVLAVACLLAIVGSVTIPIPTLTIPSHGGFMNSLWMFFFVLTGFESIIKFTEETKDKIDIPQSFYASNAISILLTVGVALALAIWVPNLSEKQELNAIGWLFAAFTGPWIVEPFKWLVVIFLLLATFVVFLSTTRYLYGLGSKADWLAPLKEVNAAAAPWVSILSVFGSGSVLSLLNNTEILVKITDLGFATIATLVASAVSVADLGEGKIVSAAVNGATTAGFLGLLGSAFL
jgi:amino acid transporter